MLANLRWLRGANRLKCTTPNRPTARGGVGIHQPEPEGHDDTLSCCVQSFASHVCSAPATRPPAPTPHHHPNHDVHHRDTTTSATYTRSHNDSTLRVTFWQRLFKSRRSFCSLLSMSTSACPLALSCTNEPMAGTGVGRRERTGRGGQGKEAERWWWVGGWVVGWVVATRVEK